jgi:glycosyltransferase 2 family protein
VTGPEPVPGRGAAGESVTGSEPVAGRGAAGESVTGPEPVPRRGAAEQPVPGSEPVTGEGAAGEPVAAGAAAAEPGARESAGGAGRSVGRWVGRAMELSRSRGFRVGFGSLLMALAIYAVVSEWHDVRAALDRLDPRWVLLALLCTAVNVALAGMVWRTVLADLGSTLQLPVAARIFFVGQLGKYLPGSVWPVVMQTELGRDHDVPRRRTATATMVSLLLSVTSALLVVLLALPFAPAALPDGFGWAIVLVVPLAVLLHPAVLGRVVDVALRLTGREGLPERTTLRGTLLATLWAFGSWTGAGLQVWALAVPLGAPADLKTAVLLVGGYGLAWAVGFIVVIAPAGAGPRELALAAVLTPVLDRDGGVVVIVLLSRVLFTVVDLAAAGAGMLAGRGHRISRS